MKKKTIAILICGMIVAGIAGCESSVEEPAAEEPVVEEAEDALSPEEYSDTAINYVYQLTVQVYNISSLGEYMVDDWEAGLSQDECIANAYELLEEIDGISESDIALEENTINILYRQLQNPPEDCQEVFNEFLVPIHDDYEVFYSLVMDGPEGYDSLDDFADDFVDAVDIFYDALVAYQDYLLPSDEISDEQSVDASEVMSNEPVVYERMNGLGTEVMGYYSILEIPQSEVTLEFLTDWYENYVKTSGHVWDIIIYSDRDDNLGVWANDAVMNKDIYLKPDELEHYTRGGNSPTSEYFNLKDGELVSYFDTSELGAAQGKDPIEVLDDYFANENYYPARWDFIEELEYQGYATDEAEAAVESWDIDWNELAVEDLQYCLHFYGDIDSLTEDDIDFLTEDLEDDEFTAEEIQYALEKMGIK